MSRKPTTSDDPNASPAPSDNILEEAPPMNLETPEPEPEPDPDEEPEPEPDDDDPELDDETLSRIAQKRGLAVVPQEAAIDRIIKAITSPEPEPGKQPEPEPDDEDEATELAYLLQTNPVEYQKEVQKRTVQRIIEHGNTVEQMIADCRDIDELDDADYAIMRQKLSSMDLPALKQIRKQGSHVQLAQSHAYNKMKAMGTNKKNDKQPNPAQTKKALDRPNPAPKEPAPTESVAKTELMSRINKRFGVTENN